jgi:predicted RecB family nuclease
MSTKISKSKFCAGVQCLKRLYWQVHEPELAAEPSGATEAIMEQGYDVGMLARTLFPGGVEVCERSLDQAIRATRELVANPQVPAIFEAVLEHGGVLVKVDILHRRRDGRWRLIEVKSSASLKEEHLDDVAIQHRVLSRCGLDVGSCCLAHINRNYVFDGGSIDVRRLFKIRNLTRRVQGSQPKLTFQLRSEFTILAMPQAPDIAPGRHCTDPVTCEFFDRCNIPRPNDHIGHLPRLHASAAEELEEMGVESIRDIPDEFELTDIQRRAATCVQTGEPWYDIDGLKAALAGLRYPLFFMDFETVNPAIPRFAGMRPYDQLPFQFSVHSRKEPGATLEHDEFLATDASDLRREFITSLCAALGKSGSIVVYSSFEYQRLSDLASWFPEFADRINAIQARLFDLLPVVREHTYHPAFAGSYSIKSVLPALVPEMRYEGMVVANGQEAGLGWESLVRGGLDHGECDRIRKALLDYCGQDTLAIVRLLEVLRARRW